MTKDFFMEQYLCHCSIGDTPDTVCVENVKDMYTVCNVHIKS